jgi:hypothetical protein
VSSLDRRRYGRQIRLAEIGEAGQAKLCAAKAAPRNTGLAGAVEVRYLAGAGVEVRPVARAPASRESHAGDTASPSEPAVADLGLRHPAAREVAAGALAALDVIRAALGLSREGPP